MGVNVRGRQDPQIAIKFPINSETSADLDKLKRPGESYAETLIRVVHAAAENKRRLESTTLSPHYGKPDLIVRRRSL